MGYPDKENEIEILKGRQGANPLDSVRAVANAADITSLQNAADAVFCDDKIYDYIARLSEATRNHEMIELGLSPRGSLSIANLARAHAFICGRNYVSPDDVADIFFDSAAHRIVLSPKARIADCDKKTVLEEIMKSTALPKISRN